MTNKCSAQTCSFFDVYMILGEGIAPTQVVVAQARYEGIARERRLEGA